MADAVPLPPDATVVAVAPPKQDKGGKPAQGDLTKVQQENEDLKKQLEKANSELAAKKGWTWKDWGSRVVNRKYEDSVKWDDKKGYFGNAKDRFNYAIRPKNWFDFNIHRALNKTWKITKPIIKYGALAYVGFPLLKSAIPTVNALLASSGSHLAGDILETIADAGIRITGGAIDTVFSPSNVAEAQNIAGGFVQMVNNPPQGDASLPVRRGLRDVLRSLSNFIYPPQ